MKTLLTALFILTLSACSNDDQTELVTIALDGEAPPISILVDSEVISMPPDAEDPIIFDLTAPWSILNFKFQNLSDKAVTIISTTYVVTDPITGKVTSSTPTIMDLTTGETKKNFSTIRASKDFNCDGLVDESEKNSATEVATCENSCNLDLSNIDCTNESLYLPDMLQTPATEDGKSIADTYRGLSFNVEARFEGWFGTPEKPVDNFYKSIFFTTQAN